MSNTIKESDDNKNLHSKHKNRPQSSQLKNQSQQQQQKSKRISHSSSLNNINLYEPYWDLNRCNIELTENKLIKQKLRINQKNFEDAFISDPNDTNCDIYIEGVIDRNRALNGDVVMVKLKEMFYWKIVDNSKNKVL